MSQSESNKKSENAERKNGNGRDNDFFKSWALKNEWKNGQLPEDKRIGLENALENFKFDASQMELRFPANLSSDERKFIHRQAQRLGYSTKSEGKEPNRFIKVNKKSSDVRQPVNVNMCPKSVQLIEKCLEKNPVSLSENFHKIQEQGRRSIEFGTDIELQGLMPKLPRMPVRTRLSEHRASLPIYNYRNQIVKWIDDFSVICVKGSTGSGKTTQVPQYILENAFRKRQRVQIMVTVPRRIAAVTLAERVSEEMGEEPGQSVGYQVRFESNYSLERTVVTYCTTGVLLRCLAMNPRLVCQMTHIIIDEIHERDRFTDFLVACLKRLLSQFRHLKIIIMGADMNIDLFVNYFGGRNFCPSLNVEGRLFDIKTCFLKEVLYLVGQSGAEGMPCHVRPPPAQIRARIDYLIQELATHPNEKDFKLYLESMDQFKFSAHYKHRIAKVSVLDIAKILGRYDWSQELVRKTAQNEEEEITLVESYKRELYMNEYLKEVDPDRVDLDLIVRLIKKIDNCTVKEEAILVFLPGLDDIMNVKRMLFYEQLQLRDKIEVTVLHSSIQAKDQRNAFRNPQTGYRKVLLSTNIAESSITVNDVVHVIDSGKAKEKSYDCTSATSLLQPVWISQASANQRQGRAGRIRPGFCYRLYSWSRYESFRDYQVPEILRLSLSELCLTAKSFLFPNCTLEKFFANLPEPPSAVNVASAIDALKNLGALTETEELSTLGHRLAKMPVDPSLGKALLLGVVFRCVDPILTIVATLSHRDPFNIPANSAEKVKLTELKLKYANREPSDFSVMQNLYEAYVGRYRRLSSRDFYEQNFLSFSSMQMVSGIRGQLLAHLFANRYINRGQSEFVKLNSNSTNWCIINAVLTSCLQPNFAQLNHVKNCYMNGFDNGIKLHHSSVLASMQSAGIPGTLLHNEWVAYSDMTCLGGVNMIKDCVSINAVTLALIGGSLHVQPTVTASPESEDSETSENMHYITINNWMRLQTTKHELQNLVKIRSHLNTILQNFFKNTTSIHNERVRDILTTVESVLKSERDGVSDLYSRLPCDLSPCGYPPRR